MGNMIRTDVRKIRLVILIAISLLIGLLIATAQAHAVSPWYEVYLSPGQTYDVSKAKWNTTVYINKAGDYTLKGQSTQCRVVIQSGGVNVYLADGLEIDPGIKAYVGSRTAAITVNDMNGTVKLISKPGADIYFGGYLTAPAIRKYGYNSKLVFETEDPSNPGTITAYRAHQSSSAGIGSAYEFAGRVSTGNIEIKSGNIIATGGYMSAGIGGGGNGNAYYITINGGNVRAVGGANGTGIGGGYHGDAYDIEINGGTIYAEGGFGAGIGSGEQSTYAKKVVINGGNIEARSLRGAGIGGGHRSEVENLRINGGNIKAIGETGIGGTAYQHYGNVKSMYITGGTIYAEGGYVGIGASVNAPGPNNIYISGGDITARSDQYALGGGGMSGVTDGRRITNVTISGGTIKLDGDKLDIGGVTWLHEVNITITGGSLFADKNKFYSEPKNQFGDVVSRTDITIDGLSGKVKLDDTDIAGLADKAHDYGMKDVWTDNGKVYFWLPSGAKVSSASSSESKYEGSVNAGSSGVLKYVDKSYTVYFLKEAKAFGSSITAEDIAYSQTFTMDKAETLAPVSGMNLQSPEEGKEFIGWKRTNALGAALYPDRAKVCNLYSYDAENEEVVEYYMEPQWRDAGDVILYVFIDGVLSDVEDIKLQKDGAEYEAVFNKDKNTKGTYTYSPSDVGSGETLAKGEYKILIKLVGETEYMDTGRTVSIGTSSLVELKLYTLTFNGNGADNGYNDSMSCIYGENYTVPDCGYTKTDYHFIGWNTEIDGTGKYYYPKLGDVFSNSDDDAEAILYAIWGHDSYTIKYDANGGEGAVPEVSVWTKEVYILANPGFLKEGYKLVGWNTTADGSGKTYAADEEVSDIVEAGESIVLYAQWEVLPEDEAGGDGQNPAGNAGGEIDSGDKMPITVIAVILVIALVGIAAVLFGRRKKS